MWFSAVFDPAAVNCDISERAAGDGVVPNDSSTYTRGCVCGRWLNGSHRGERNVCFRAIAPRSCFAPAAAAALLFVAGSHCGCGGPVAVNISVPGRAFAPRPASNPHPRHFSRGWANSRRPLTTPPWWMPATSAPSPTRSIRQPPRCAVPSLLSRFGRTRAGCWTDAHCFCGERARVAKAGISLGKVREGQQTHCID